MEEAKRPKNFPYPLEELIKTSGIIFYHCSLDDNFPILFISKNVERILGFRQIEFKQNDNLWTNRIHQEDKEYVLNNFKTIIEQKAFISEFRFRHKDGHYIWLRDEVKLIRDEAGVPESIVGSAIEITSRKKAEQELHNLNKTLERRVKEHTKDLTVANRKLRLLELAVANINDMVVITKVSVDNPLDFSIVFVNKAFEEFTGYSFSEVEGKNPILLNGPETSSKTVEKVQSSILDHEPVRAEFINYKKNGEPYWVELDMSPFPTGDSVHEFWVSINRNITARKETEKILEESERRYRAYTELAFDAIFEITLDGIITDCNARACKIFGYSRDELIGKDCGSLTPEEQKGLQPEIFLDKVTTGDKVWHRIYKRKDGTHIPTEINTKIYEQGDQKYVIAYVRDISERKEYEKKITDSLKEKETLLAEIHHRVKNNLAIISGLLEMQTFKADEEELVKALKESQARIQSIAMVHEKLYQSDSFTNIPIDTYIDELLHFISNAFNGQTTNVEVLKNIDSISMDVNKSIPCGLILNELITNAYKHAFANTQNPQISISLHKKETQILLRVEDNGKGLPDDFKINEPSSLGTTLIQTLVKQLEGTLDVSSENGACFEISFKIEK